jgi:hypothetical protein
MKTLMTSSVGSATLRVHQTSGGIVQIVVWLTKKNIMPLGVVTTQSFLDPPEIATRQVAGGGAASSVNNNRNCDLDRITWV